MPHEDERDYELTSYTAQAKGEHYASEVLKAINGVGFVRRIDLPPGFSLDQISVLNKRFEEDGLPKRLRFVDDNLKLVLPTSNPISKKGKKEERSKSRK